MNPKRIHENLEATHSRPFLIRLSDGSVLRVPHTDYIMLSKDGVQAALFADGNSFKIIDTEHIVSIDFTRAAPPKKPTGEQK